MYSCRTLEKTSWIRVRPWEPSQEGAEPHARVTRKLAWTRDENCWARMMLFAHENSNNIGQVGSYWVDTQ